jgi:hypothetical protein
MSQETTPNIVLAAVMGLVAPYLPESRAEQVLPLTEEEQVRADALRDQRVAAAEAKRARRQAKNLRNQ